MPLVRRLCGRAKQATIWQRRANNVGQQSATRTGRSATLAPLLLLARPLFQPLGRPARARLLLARSLGRGCKSRHQFADQAPDWPRATMQQLSNRNDFSLLAKTHNRPELALPLLRLLAERRARRPHAVGLSCGALHLASAKLQPAHFGRPRADFLNLSAARG